MTPPTAPCIILGWSSPSSWRSSSSPAEPPAPHVNETHYLTKAKHYWDPAYCPGDLFLDSADAHLPFYWTVGWLTKWLSLPAAAWVGRIAAWLLLAVGLAATVHVPSRRRRGRRRSRRSCGSCSSTSATSPASGSSAAFTARAASKASALPTASCCSAWRPSPRAVDGAVDLVRRRGGVARAGRRLGRAGGAGVWLAEPRATRPPLARCCPGLCSAACLSLPGLLPALALDRGVPRRPGRRSGADLCVRAVAAPSGAADAACATSSATQRALRRARRRRFAALAGRGRARSAAADRRRPGERRSRA